MTSNDIKIQPERFTPPPHSIYSCVKTRGFTLVEMSIVLVVIGLIVATIAGGKSMIHASEVRSVMVDVKKYEAATRLFIDQYDAWPGDMRNASAYWPGYVANGNGNNLLDVTEEKQYFWKELSIAGFIDGHYANGSFTEEPGMNMPLSKLNGAGFIMESNSGGDGIGNTLTFATRWGNYMDGAAITAADAHKIDLKIDDGLHYSGKVTFFTANNGVPGGSCTNGTTIYLSDPEPKCYMFFWYDPQ